jgi:hypothetical protein
MQSVNLAPTVLPYEVPEPSQSGFQELPTVVENPEREKSLFLTSLLLTSSLVAFLLTHVPQMFSLPGLPSLLQQVSPTKPALLDNMLLQSAQASKLTTSPASNTVDVSGIVVEPGKPTIVVQGTTSPITLSLPATSESYVVYVLVQSKRSVAVSSLASQPQ